MSYCGGVRTLSRVVLTALQANARMPEHKTEGRISVHVLSGHLQLKAAGRSAAFQNNASASHKEIEPGSGGRATGPRLWRRARDAGGTQV